MDMDGVLGAIVGHALVGVDVRVVRGACARARDARELVREVGQGKDHGRPRDLLVGDRLGARVGHALVGVDVVVNKGDAGRQLVALGKRVKHGDLVVRGRAVSLGVLNGQALAVAHVLVGVGIVALADLVATHDAFGKLVDAHGVELIHRVGDDLGVDLRVANLLDAIDHAIKDVIDAAAFDLLADDVIRHEAFGVQHLKRVEGVAIDLGARGVARAVVGVDERVGLGAPARARDARRHEGVVGIGVQPLLRERIIVAVGLLVVDDLADLVVEVAGHVACGLVELKVVDLDLDVVKGRQVLIVANLVGIGCRGGGVVVLVPDVALVRRAGHRHVAAAVVVALLLLVPEARLVIDRAAVACVGREVERHDLKDVGIFARGEPRTSVELLDDGNVHVGLVVVLVLDLLDVVAGSDRDAVDGPLSRQELCAIGVGNGRVAVVVAPRGLVRDVDLRVGHVDLDGAVVEPRAIGVVGGKIRPSVARQRAARGLGLDGRGRVIG